ncbi:MAG: hypothetical protein JJE52_16025 [Acidimicrobiia bacterium]|nr:hypothetical protein [Acidimicrobiia bacterium]
MVATSHPDTSAGPSPQRLGLVALGAVAGLFALLFTFGSAEPAILERPEPVVGASADAAGVGWTEAAP